MQLRGILDLGDMRHDKFRSAQEEDFVAEINKLHDQRKGQLKHNNKKHKIQIE
jgi:hypothetical protein